MNLTEQILRSTMLPNAKGGTIDEEVKIFSLCPLFVFSLTCVHAQGLLCIPHATAVGENTRCSCTGETVYAIGYQSGSTNLEFTSQTECGSNGSQTCYVYSGFTYVNQCFSAVSKESKEAVLLPATSLFQLALNDQSENCVVRREVFDHWLEDQLRAQHP